jgi:hypothetical protein
MAYSHLSPEEFRFHERHGYIDKDSVTDVLKGKAAGCVFRDVIPSPICKTISDNYLRLSVVRGSEDGVPGTHVGPYHYRKSLQEYLDDVTSTKDKVAALFEGAVNPLDTMIEAFATALREQGNSFRLANYLGRPAGNCVARDWSDSGEFILLPHEDVAQLQTVGQRGFEIQRAAEFTVVGVNICVRSDGDGSNLMIWNAMPDADERRSLGVEEVGYPYPAEYLRNFDTLSISINEGDVYLINGKCIHAVASKGVQRSRITLSFFMSHVNENLVVYWT